MATAKEKMTAIIQEQPDDSSYEELLKELSFSLMIERGLEDSRRDRTVSHEEMLREIRSFPLSPSPYKKAVHPIIRSRIGSVNRGEEAKAIVTSETEGDGAGNTLGENNLNQGTMRVRLREPTLAAETMEMHGATRYIPDQNFG